MPLELNLQSYSKSFEVITIFKHIFLYFYNNINTDLIDFQVQLS